MNYSYSTRETSMRLFHLCILLDPPTPVFSFMCASLVFSRWGTDVTKMEWHLNPSILRLSYFSILKCLMRKIILFSL